MLGRFVFLIVAVVCLAGWTSAVDVWPQPAFVQVTGPSAVVGVSPYEVQVKLCAACRRSVVLGRAVSRYLSYPNSVCFPFHLPATSQPSPTDGGSGPSVRRVRLDMPALAVQRAQSAIGVDGDGAEVPLAGTDESYTLRLNSTDGRRYTVYLSAPTVFGLLRALETLAQLTSFDAQRPWPYAVVLQASDAATATTDTATALAIDDRPAYSWRGVRLSSAAQRLSTASLRRTIDGMAGAKLNVLHWRLFDAVSLPLADDVLRAANASGTGAPALRYDLAQLHAVVDYARDRGVRVVPELPLLTDSLAWSAPLQLAAACPRTAQQCGAACVAVDPAAPQLADAMLALLAALQPAFHSGPASPWHFGGWPSPAPCWAERGAAAGAGEPSQLFNAAFAALLRAANASAVVAADSPLAASDDDNAAAARLLHVQRPLRDDSATALAGRSLVRSDRWQLDTGDAATWQLFYASDPLADLPASATLVGVEAYLDGQLVDDGSLDATLWPRAAALAERLWTGRSTVIHDSDGDDDNDNVEQRLRAFRCTALLRRGVGAAPMAAYDECLLPGQLVDSASAAGHSWSMLYDPSTLLLELLAWSTLLYAVWRSRIFSEQLDAALQQQHAEQDEEAVKAGAATRPRVDDGFINMRTAVFLPLFGSLVLVVLFFFLDWLSYLFVAFIAASAVFSLLFVLSPATDAVASALPAAAALPLAGCSALPALVRDASLSLLLSLLTAVAVVLAWLISRHWAVSDLIALCFVVSSLSGMRLPNLKVATVILSLFFVYDVFWVFLSSCLFGKNVMVSVAVSLPSLPILISLPKTLSPGATMLGLGDLILPGLLLCYLYRFDASNASASLAELLLRRQGYFWPAFFGYVVGLETALVMLLTFQRAQPALLYLVPCTLLPTFLLAWYRGQLRCLWKNLPVPQLLPSSALDADAQPIIVDKEPIDDDSTADFGSFHAGDSHELSLHDAPSSHDLSSFHDDDDDDQHPLAV